MYDFNRFVTLTGESLYHHVFPKIVSFFAQRQLQGVLMVAEIRFRRALSWQLSGNNNSVPYMLVRQSSGSKNVLTTENLELFPKDK